MNMNTGGVIACPEVQAAEVGVQVLGAGGNAFDAAIAAAFVQMIVDPFMCGIGGMSFAHLWSPSLGKHQVIDGSLRVGSKAYPEMWVKDYQGRAPYSGASIFSDHRSEIGYTSICVPGTVAVFGEVHRQYCTWSWSDLLQPAVRIAREGFKVTPYMRGYIFWPPFPGTPDGLTRLRATEPCARLYLHPDGSFVNEGEVIYNPDYAYSLELLAARGSQEFYQGELAKIIGEDLEKNGSYVTKQDLEKYRPRVLAPVATTYRKYTAYSSPSPAGGSLLLESLNMLELFELGNLSHNGPEHLSILAKILQLAFQDRLRYLRDPETAPSPPEDVLLSKEHAQSLIRNCSIAGKASSGGGSSNQHTTHLVVVDRHGNVASITHSLGYASGVITPALGFIYNNGMNNFDPIPGRPNSIAPGKLRLSSGMPTILFEGTEPRLAVGALGGNAILSACLQTISNVLGFGMTAVEAVSSPRIHTEEETVWCEFRIRSDVCNALEKEGYAVERFLLGYAPWMAQVQLVRLLPGGRLDGASDPRADGGAVMYVSYGVR